VTYRLSRCYLAARMRCAARLGGPEVQFDVAILFPRSSWLWDNATDMTGSCTTDKKGDPECTKLGPQCVATIDLYCSTEAGGPAGMCSDCLAAWTAKLDAASCPKDTAGVFDSTLLTYCQGLGPAGPFNNEDQGSGSMDYQAQVYGLFRALTQISDIQVDLIDEDELTADGLSSFKALILTEPDVPTESEHKATCQLLVIDLSIDLSRFGVNLQITKRGGLSLIDCL
jgi:hypothetical protein